MSASSRATLESHRRLLAVAPQLARIAPLRELLAVPDTRTLYHAGPPFPDPLDLPAPVRNSVAAAARHEGWVDGAVDARDALASGAIRLLPAQDLGLVTPLAFVVGPSMFCVEVNDANAPGSVRLSPLNDGPPPDALRLGTGRDAGLAALRRITGGIGADLARALAAPAPLLPLMAAALADGDDLHGRVDAANARVRRLFGSGLHAESEAYLAAAGQFALNVIMAAAALMQGAGAGVAGSDLVIACGGNGRELGWKLARDPQTWITRPARRPVGPRLPGHDAAEPLPAIGDSAVVDALGFGAACLRFAPELAAGLEGHVDHAYASDAAHAPFVGPHPALALPGLRVGLDLTRPRSCLGIMLGMVGERGDEGLVGRGVAPWPQE